MPSAQEMIEAAHVGALFGGLGGAAGTYRAAGLPIHAKGKLGETMTRTKARARGEGPIGGVQKRPRLKGGGYTVTDARALRPGDDPGLIDDPRLVFESKLGSEARLSPRQIQAQNQFGDRYVVDGWRFTDVGKATGTVLSALGAQFTDDEQFPWRMR